MLPYEVCGQLSVGVGRRRTATSSRGAALRSRLWRRRGRPPSPPAQRQPVAQAGQRQRGGPGGGFRGKFLLKVAPGPVGILAYSVIV